jgi:hypothetical protein
MDSRRPDDGGAKFLRNLGSYKSHSRNIPEDGIIQMIHKFRKCTFNRKRRQKVKTEIKGPEMGNAIRSGSTALHRLVFRPAVLLTLILPAGHSFEKIGKKLQDQSDTVQG